MLQVTRRWWLLASLGTPFAIALSAQSLILRMDSGNSIHISAPNAQFLSGKSLERLKYGSSVTFMAQLSLSTDANKTVQARTLARFAFSYDIWEEKFSATRFLLSKQEEGRKKAANLSQLAIQSWCMENLTIDASKFPLDQPIWVRLEIRAEEGRDAVSVIGEPGISITRLIDLFGQPPRTAQDRLQLDAGPIRLRDLKHGA